jgi:hypothetical protein
MSIEDIYPVRLTAQRPERFDRSQVFLRLLILIAISILMAFAWLMTLAYLALPIAAAAFISRDGAEKFRAETAPRVRRWLHWVIAFDSYFAFLSDRMPTEKPEETATFEVDLGGKPTTSSALLRLLTSIPSAFALVLLTAAAMTTSLVAGAFILVREDYPDALYRFHLGVVRWGARLLAYHGSLVEAYPPFDLDMGDRPISPTPQPSNA